MKGMEIDPALQWLLRPSKTPEKRTTTQSPSRHRKHNHYTMGRMGYNPKLARLMNHDKHRGGNKS